MVNKKIAVPKDASAVVLLNQDLSKVLWAQRNPQLSFLGGYHAFPGGKTEPADSKIEVKNCAQQNLAKFIVGAVREIFEETGVLLTRGGDKLTKGQRVSLHDDLISGRFSFAEILETWGLRIDAEDFFYTGFWTTPQFSPVRFKTRFFIAVCPPKQMPYTAISELTKVEFIEPKEALQVWENSEVLISPPVLITLQELTEKIETQRRKDAKKNSDKNKDLHSSAFICGFPFNTSASLHLCGEKLLEKSQKLNGQIHHIELNPRLICFPLKTQTLPPATHTNCFIVGKKEFAVIDAASREKAEQQKLFDLIDSFIEKNFSCREIIVSHLHQDHFGGEIALQKHLLEKFGLEIPISAHKFTAESLQGKVKINKLLEDEQIIELKDESGKSFGLKILHAPGHARGHLCFYDEEKGFLLSSDNVVGTGSVLIAPPEGNMRDYLRSLERMKNLPNLRFLCGSHGAAVIDAKGKIESYIAHRLERERKILKAVQTGAKTPREIVEKVYNDISPELWDFAEKSVEAHLEKLKADGTL